MSEPTDNGLIALRLKQYFPALCKMLEQLPAASFHLTSIPKNTPVFSVGQACENYLLVTSGSVKVSMLTRGGKNVLLYRVGSGQSCIITTSCLLGKTSYPTFAQTETVVEAISISQDDFRQALDQCHEFRDFVFDGLGQRLADVMARLETINFTSVDSRLAEALLALNKDARLSRITHDQIAEEIGTAREVVSRHLKKYEKDGCLKLSRGAIEIINQDKLYLLRDQVTD